ncbi:MAG: GAF domain-containing protein, partial [Myxococcota bacterium]
MDIKSLSVRGGAVILLCMDPGIGHSLTARLMMSGALFAAVTILLARTLVSPELMAVGIAGAWIVFSLAVFRIAQRGLQTAFQTGDQKLTETNHRLSAQLSKLSFLNYLSRDLAHSLELEETMRRLTERVIESLNVDELAVLLFERDQRQVFLLTASGFDHEDHVVRVPFRADRGITGVAVRERTSVYVPDLSQDHREVAYRADRDPQGSLLSIPMVFEAQVVGVLNFSSRLTDAFD